MSATLHSRHWYRVCNLRPSLRAHIRLERQVQREEVWYVAHDAVSGKTWRISARAERIVALLDGKRTLAELWALVEQLGDDMPSQDDILRILSNLQAADALSIDSAQNIAELVARQDEEKQTSAWRRFANPLAIRMRLFDPNAFLNRTIGRVRPLFTRTAAICMSLLVAVAVVIGLRNADQLGANLMDTLLAPQLLLPALIVYPIVKAIHELAHAYSVKVRGGDVHEMGLMWLLFIPVPYVDASAATAFPRKRDRVIVSAAGIIAELLIASIAMIAWAFLEPGWSRSLAYSVVLVAGVSTFIVNANPLLRYDGYFALADGLEMPNLAQRASAYWQQLLRRVLVGASATIDRLGSKRERFWLVSYGALSFAYRLLVVFTVAVIVARWSRWLAITLLAISLCTIVVVPLGKLAKQVLSPGAAVVGGRRVGLRVAGAMAALVAVFMIPMPLSKSALGVMWLPEQGELRVYSDGQLTRWLATPGSIVAEGQALAELEDPTRETALAAAEANYQAAQARYLSARATDAVDAGSMMAQLRSSEAALDDARLRADARTVTSPMAGRFIVARPQDHVGRYYHQGDALGFVVGEAAGTVLAVVDQDSIGIIKSRAKAAQVYLSDAPDVPLAATISRITPAANNRLPSPALALHAGGSIATDPTDSAGTKTLVPVFRIELAVDRPFQRIGGRAVVRFDLGNEVLAMRIARVTRQLLLRHFDV